MKQGATARVAPYQDMEDGLQDGTRIAFPTDQSAQMRPVLLLHMNVVVFFVWSPASKLNLMPLTMSPKVRFGYILRILIRMLDTARILAYNARIERLFKFRWTQNDPKNTSAPTQNLCVIDLSRFTHSIWAFKGNDPARLLCLCTSHFPHRDLCGNNRVCQFISFNVRLPDKTAWADVRKFYEIQMDKAQCQIVPSPSALLENVSLPNDISSYQTTVWVRGNPTFSIAQLNSPRFIELFIAIATP